MNIVPFSKNKNKIKPLNTFWRLSKILYILKPSSTTSLFLSTVKGQNYPSSSVFFFLYSLIFTVKLRICPYRYMSCVGALSLAIRDNVLLFSTTHFQWDCKLFLQIVYRNHCYHQFIQIHIIAPHNQSTTQSSLHPWQLIGPPQRHVCNN